MSIIELHNGTERFCGLNPPEDDHLKMRAGMRSFSEYLDSVGVKRPPRSEWKPISNRGVFTSKWFLDQMRSSGCVGGSSAGAFMRARWRRTGIFEVLSGASIYARINNNLDQGAVITNAMTALTQYGACLHSEFDYPSIFLNQMPSNAITSAKTRLVAEALTATTFDDLCIAVQMGLDIVYPVGVDKQWESYDADGAVHAVAGVSNHSVSADGLAQTAGGVWMLDGVNDWTPTWGREKNGRFYAKEASISGAATQDDAYVIIVAAVDTGAQEAG